MAVDAREVDFLLEPTAAVCAVLDSGDRAPLTGRPSNRCVNHLELMRAPEEPGHARHSTG